VTAPRRRGRPRCCPDEILERVVVLRGRGALLRQICDELNAEHIRTPGGGMRWYPSHVSRLLGTIDAQNLAESYSAGRAEVRQGRRPPAKASLGDDQGEEPPSTQTGSPRAALNCLVVDPGPRRVQEKLPSRNHWRRTSSRTTSRRHLGLPLVDGGGVVAGGRGGGGGGGPGSVGMQHPRRSLARPPPRSCGRCRGDQY
jgi:hypothetical protein